ncbi:uncharacterized protein H6S33_001570 [Morchella sextelata]|uniref:uncharacterized protein n=1 Tax=Morchella sextelata TaxID=1174677 RepID=UPI001D0450A7|nr:uncharacterized protein H6S33_001570 [Morchella sextelata]KAH0608436.1 hypothetical protein H6S33_001570 [Morchella sextelata]
MFSNTSIVAYVLGLLTFVLAPRLLGGFFRLFNYGPPPRRDIYGLEHALLNMRLPPETMWLNMAYWKNTSDFPTACNNLLQLLLEKSEILKTPSSRPIRLWDLGFDCGDQTISLCTELSRAGLTLCKYDGLTINRSQFLHAQARIQAHIEAHPYLGADNNKKDSLSIIELHLTDASKPSSPPSRAPALQHVSRELESSLLAFDLLRSGSATALQRVLLRLVCAVTQILYANRLTEEEYRDMLAAAGYARENIAVCDVSADVFPGLERFISARGLMVRDVGVLKGWGGFGAVGRVVGWWGRSGVVRGCVLVARRA